MRRQLLSIIKVNPAYLSLYGVVAASLLALVAFAITSPTAAGQTRVPVPKPAPRDAIDVVQQAPEAMRAPTAGQLIESLLRYVALPSAEAAVRRPPTVTRQVTVRNGDTLMGILTRAGTDRRDGHEAIVALSHLYDPRRLRIGQEITLEFTRAPDGDGDGDALAGLRLADDVERDVIVRRDPTGDFESREVIHELRAEFARAGGVIDDSLYLAAKKAGLPEKTLIQLIRIFSFDVDFQREVQPGDSFELLFERFHDADGAPVKEGAIHMASMTLKGKKLTYYRYAPTDTGRAEYFDEKGMSVRKTLMRTPIDGARLTSRFGRRRHPILGYSTMHRGIDFGAPSGTPIMAAGDGVVEVAGWNGAYGRYIRIRHNGTYKTAYAHLSKLARGVRKGKRVDQGQVIGYVGSTGRSTGPHLHYEVHISGRQTNPLSVRMPTGRKLEGAELKRFQAVVAKGRALIAATPLMRRYAAAE